MVGLYVDVVVIICSSSLIFLGQLLFAELWRFLRPGPCRIRKAELVIMKESMQAHLFMVNTFFPMSRVLSIIVMIMRTTMIHSKWF